MREIIYDISLHCHHQNDSCINLIKMGRNESHFNVSLIVRDKVSTNRNLFEEKEPKQYQTKVLLITSLMPYG